MNIIKVFIYLPSVEISLKKLPQQQHKIWINIGVDEINRIDKCIFTLKLKFFIIIQG